MEKLLISACLLGLSCRYDGKAKGLDKEIISALNEKYALIPFCPEIYGGLPTRRQPSEIVRSFKNISVVTESGKDVTRQYLKGAEEALKLCRLLGCKKALLKANSPSCGIEKVYDGSFSRNLIKGMGITAALLSDDGIELFCEEDIASLI